MSYTYPQEQLLAVVPKCSALIGMPSAAIVMWEVVSDHRQKAGNPINRALIFVCWFQFWDAFGWFLSTWAVPAGSWAYSAGTQASCSFQGFLLQVVIGAPLYSATMSIYFFWVVRQELNAKQLERRELFFHIWIFAYALGSSFIMLGLDQYNHVGTVCWVIGSPPGCGDSSKNFNPDVPCERGNNAWLFGLCMFYIPLWCCILIIIVGNVMIYIKLKKADMGEDARWLAKEAMLYCLAFCITWAPSTGWSIASWTGGGGFWLDMASALFEPLAGLWYLLIFLRNRKGSRKKLRAFFCCEKYIEAGDDLRQGNSGEQEGSGK